MEEILMVFGIWMAIVIPLALFTIIVMWANDKWG